MEEESANRAEAERLLSIASKFLESRDLSSSKDFALLAQETAPLLDKSDLILAVADVLLAAPENSNKNWYSILQLSPSSSPDLIKKQYRRLALLLHPDKNNYPFADEAFRLVKEAWSVLSDPEKKRVFDSQQQQQQLLLQKKKDKLPVRKQGKYGGTSFWTACPYCYNMYEYPRVYVDCCLKCGNCGRAMHAAEIGEMPPMVEGKDSYYCCWGFFPLGFKGNEEEGFVDVFGGKESGRSGSVTPVYSSGRKKRGRPRKNV